MITQQQYQEQQRSAMNSSDKSESSTSTLQFEENPVYMKISEEIEELPQEDEHIDIMFDKIHILQQKVNNNKDLTSKQQQKYLFDILKLKCQSGQFFDKKVHRTCTQIRKEMQSVMKDFQMNFCYLVFLGSETSGNIHIIPTVINQDLYFKVNFQTYTYIVYEIKREATLDYEPVISESQTSIDLNVSKENIPQQQQLNQQNQNSNYQTRNKAISFMNSSDSQSNLNLSNQMNNSKKTNMMSSYQPQPVTQQLKIPLQPNKQNRQSLLVPTIERDQKRKSSNYLKKQIEKDELRIQKSIQAQQKYESTLNHQEVPSKEEIIKIAKNYQQFLGKPSIKKPFNCKDYALAVQKAFHQKSIQPKIIVIKKEPKGDYFWDYECDNDVTLHSWNFFKTKDFCVVAVI